MLALIGCSCNGCNCEIDRKVLVAMLVSQLLAVTFLAVIALVKGRY